MFDQAQEGDAGVGPYSVVRDEDDAFFYIMLDGQKVGTGYPLHKTALRRCRSMNAVAGPIEPTPEPIEPTPEPIEPTPEPSAEELVRAEEMERFPSVARHAWLEDAGSFAAKLLRERAELDVPHTVRVSLGWPRGRKAIGECWHAVASLDGHREIFVSPALDDGAMIVSTLVHELIHASLPDDAKHGPLFAKPARRVGLEGRLTATHAGEELAGLIETWVMERGVYPARGLDAGARLQPKQSTRLLKAMCPSCGYTIRVTKVWAEKGLPVCGQCEEEFELT